MTDYFEVRLSVSGKTRVAPISPLNYFFAGSYITTASSSTATRGASTSPFAIRRVPSTIIVP